MVNHNGSFLKQHELQALGFRALGENVLIHRSAVMIGCEAISIGCQVRIDPFCVLSAGEAIDIGRNVHIASHCSLSGSAPILLEDFCGLSQGVRLFSASDDYSGQSLTNPTVPLCYRNVECAPVVICRHAIIGSGCVVLPGSIVEAGASVGAMSLVKGRLAAWTVNAGVPARPLRQRRQDLLTMEANYLSEFGQGKP